jgi:hypothetical protein
MLKYTTAVCIVISTLLALSACDSGPWQAGWNQFVGLEQSGLDNIQQTGIQRAQDSGFQAGSGL